MERRTNSLPISNELSCDTTSRVKKACQDGESRRPKDARTDLWKGRGCAKAAAEGVLEAVIADEVLRVAVDGHRHGLRNAQRSQRTVRKIIRTCGDCEECPDEPF